MKRLFSGILLVSMFIITSCGNGSPTIPGLSSIIIKALKSGDEDMLKKTYPSADEFIYLYNTYYTLDYPNEAKREKEAIGKAASVRLNLTEDFRTIRRQGEQLGIKWGTAKLINFSFLKGDHNQGFQTAEVTLTVGDNTHKYDLLYTAYEVEGKWYLVENFKWDKAAEDVLLSPSNIPAEKPINE